MILIIPWESPLRIEDVGLIGLSAMPEVLGVYTWIQFFNIELPFFYSERNELPWMGK
jgi:hypothetical protein